MKKSLYRALACSFISVCLFSACHDDNLLSVGTEPNHTGNQAIDELPLQPGMAFIKLKASPEITTRAATEHLTRAKVFDDTKIKVEQVFDMTTEYADLKRSRGLDRWFVVRFDKSKDVNQVLDELRKDPAIEKAHGNVEIVPAKVSYRPASRAPIDPSKLLSANDGQGYLGFNDPYLKYQWHYMTTIESYGWFKEGADIDLFPAWQKETGDPNVVVAVMDSGIDFSHEDLAASAWKGTDKATGAEIHGRNFWYAESGQGDPNVIIPGAHGTHVAGTIAARNNNGVGISGVAGGNGQANSGVRLMSCEIYGRDDAANEVATSAAIAKAFEFAAENGALVCNCSWGYAFDRKKHLNNEYFHKLFKSQFALLKEGIDYFTDYAGCDPTGKKKLGSYMKGGLVFFASGNDSQNDIEMIPASYERVVAVGAFSSTGIPTDYMNKGPWVDILAPGGTTESQEVPKGILSTVPKAYYTMKTGPYPNTDFTLPSDNNYAYAQGTSMATPHVTGIAALIVSKFGKDNPNFTNENLRSRILSAVKASSPYLARPEANLAGKMGVGYIDANFALSDAETQSPDAPTIEVEDYSTHPTKGYYDAKINWQVTADADALNAEKTAFAYDIALYKKVDPSKPVQTTTAFSYNKSLGEGMEYEFTDLETDQEYIVKVTARDRFGNQSRTAEKTFRTRLNHAPEFTAMVEDNLKLLDTQPYYHKLLPVVDADNHTWTYTTTQLPSGVEFRRVANGFDLLIKVGTPGKYEFDITLTDQLGGKTTRKIAYEVISHKAPTKTKNLADVSLFENDKAVEIDLAQIFDAMPHHILSFSASTNNATIAKAEITGTKLRLTPGKRGTATVTITATDGVKSTSTTIQVIVTGANAPDTHAVYPVPAHSYIKALMRSGVRQVKAIVTSLRGQKLIDETIEPDAKTHEITLGIDRLAPGTYYLLLKTDRVTSKHTFIKK